MECCNFKNNILKTLAIVFGIIFIIIGILGFVPQAMDGDLLFGLFRVNTVHNIIHLTSGVVALICGLSSEYASRLYFQIFGVIYGLVTLLGLYYQEHDIFGIIAHNKHDIWLHAVISAVSLFLGFSCCTRNKMDGCCDKDEVNENINKDKH